MNKQQNARADKMTKLSSQTGAEEIRWDLSDLYSDQEDLKKEMVETDLEADAFAGLYRGRIESLTAAELADSLRSFERLQDRMGRALTYAFLNWCTNTEDSSRGALMQGIREKCTLIGHKLLFYEIELIHLDSAKADQLLRSAELEPFSHYLEVLLLKKRHILSEPEEKILSEKSVTGPEAWSRFFDEILGRARFSLKGEELTEQEVLSRLYEADRDVRKEAASSFTAGLQKELRTLTYVFNTVLAEKASEDRLRNYDHWLASRNLSNEITDEAVEVLTTSVIERYDLVARFYRLKKQILGLDELFDFDRYAPIEELDRRFQWSEARKLVLEAYSAFHTDMGSIAGLFFEQKWIDAALVPGKRGGAFSHRAVPQVHPYIMMNFTGNVRDVQTLAHELGHGVHQYLSREKGSLQGSTPLTTSEMASVFGEMLVFERLLQAEDDPSRRLALLVGKIDDTIATVFRQVAMNRFEDRIHNIRRTEGELSVERLNQCWIDAQEEMFQGSVTLGEHYQIWWSYIPHFIHTPGYVYAYAFGELLVLALYGIYQQNQDTFPVRYLQLLSEGGADWPHVLLSRLGVDLQDPCFWKEGLGAIERFIVQAEEIYH
jgi:oligoendopeptidase F